MKNLGEMGESVFRLWCAQSGLICNGSKIDRTGWDFYVEFPFRFANDSFLMHESAYECKVQVKATDNNKGKVSVSLSNLRRMSTALMPTFFVFIEFDGEESAQKAYLVHVDKAIITKILKRMRDIDQKSVESKYNKNTMLIHYGDAHIIKPMNGIGLKESLLKCIGFSFSEYVIDKKKFLQSVGYESSVAEMVFSIGDKDGVKALLDVSLGLRESVNLKRFDIREKRFGILSKYPIVSGTNVSFKVDDIKPVFEGIVIFKDERFCDGLSFDVKIYVSPFNQGVLEKHKKLKIVGPFFSFIFTPYAQQVVYSFSFDRDVRLNLKKFRDVFELIYLINSSGKKLVCHLVFDEFPVLDFDLNCSANVFEYSDVREMLDCALNILDSFGFTDVVDMSFEEIFLQMAGVLELYKILKSSAELSWAEFNLNSNSFSCNVLEDAGYVGVVSYAIGLYRFSVIFVLIGSLEAVGANRYRLTGKEKIIEKRFVTRVGTVLTSDMMKKEFDQIEKKYSERCHLFVDFKF